MLHGLRNEQGVPRWDLLVLIPTSTFVLPMNVPRPMQFSSKGTLQAADPSNNFAKKKKKEEEDEEEEEEESSNNKS